MQQSELDEHVDRLRRQASDDGRVEAKASETSLSKDVWDTVSAFANTQGGAIILGLAEREGFRALPTFALDRVRDQFVDGMGDGNPAGARLSHPPTYRLFRLTVDDLPVLVVEVDENLAGSKPCFVTARGMVAGSFKRVDDKDVTLSATEIFEFQHVLVPHGADRQPVDGATVADLDGPRISDLLERKARSKALRGTTSRAESLRRLNVVEGTGKPQLAALLTLGSYPQQFFPRLLVDVVVHPTNEKSSPAEARRYLDREECEGPLAEVVDDAVRAVVRNLRTESTVTGRGRVDELEIPDVVLREAIANAVVHREYHPLFQGQPVTVDVFPDRVVVTSPGSLWGGKTLQNLDDGYSRCRNPTLLQLLQDVPLSTGEKAAEGGGGGIRLMINSMEARALDRPRFRATPDSVSVELRRHGVEIAANREWLRSRTTRPLEDHEGPILLLAARNDHVDVATVKSALHIDSDDARRLLSTLADEGVLRRTTGDDYELRSSARRTPLEVEVLAALSAQEPRGIAVIVEQVGRRADLLRPVLRRLVADGLVVPTAPPTSRLRKYLLKG